MKKDLIVGNIIVIDDGYDNHGCHYYYFGLILSVVEVGTIKEIEYFCINYSSVKTIWISKNSIISWYTLRNT